MSSAGRTVSVSKDGSAPARCAKAGCGRCSSEAHRPEAHWSFTVTIGEVQYGPFTGYHFDITSYAEEWRPLPKYGADVDAESRN